MRITPSVLNADLSDLAGTLARIPSSDAVHVDIMDNHFVPNMTFGLPVVEALRPATPIEPYADMLGELDQMLLMTVEPGFGGQKFLDLVLPKIRRARRLVAATGQDIWIQVDGGVGVETIGRCAEAGADVFVAGTAVFRADDPDAMVRQLREQATAACSH